MSAAIALVSPKTHHNIGSVLRTADCFGASMVLVQGTRYKRSGMDVRGAFGRVPLIHTDSIRDQIPFSHVPVAIEITDDAGSLEDFCHPANALYVFGPEDGSLGRDSLSFCRNVIRIPTRRCLNLGVCVGVVLYDRAAKFSKLKKERELAKVADREADQLIQNMLDTLPRMELSGPCPYSLLKPRDFPEEIYYPSS